MAVTALAQISPALINFPPPLAPTFTGLAPVWSGDIDVTDGGVYQITGTVKITPASPTFARVRLCDQLSGRIVRETWSDATTGAYLFTHIRNGDFYVVSFDHTGAYNTVIADRLVPELMS